MQQLVPLTREISSGGSDREQVPSGIAGEHDGSPGRPSYEYVRNETVFLRTIRRFIGRPATGLCTKRKLRDAQKVTQKERTLS